CALVRVVTQTLQVFRKRCRSFANAAGVLETPGLSRNAALRKAAFSPEAGVVETLQAFSGLLQAF
ncbi:hypothetical protein, partial [Nigerium sp.]|uniref:hypothetical protein n=1 Tax=Nigerium sp. TaxID=2042655 RepID=UPI003221E537